MIAAEADADDFLRRAATRLRAGPPDAREPIANPAGDHRLNGLHPLLLPGGPPRPAAVLVPIVARGDRLMILLTVRTTGLRTHSGQVAFPGGKIDPTDPSPLDAALREAEEEIGLARDGVTPLGYLDPYWSGTNFLITPVVARLPVDPILRPNPHEVAEIFEVPLDFLMNADNHELHAREWKGDVRQYYAMPYRDRYIWGVTAGIIHNLYMKLRDESGDEPG